MNKWIYAPILILAVLTASLFGYTSTLKQRLENNQIKIEQIEKDFVTLSKTLDNLQSRYDALNEATKSQRDSINNIRGQTSVAIKNIEKEHRNADHVNLTDSVSGMLSEYCSSVRGSECPDP